jgi:hypothetical protein
MVDGSGLGTPYSVFRRVGTEPLVRGRTGGDGALGPGTEPFDPGTEPLVIVGDGGPWSSFMRKNCSGDEYYESTSSICDLAIPSVRPRQCQVTDGQAVG